MQLMKFVWILAFGNLSLFGSAMFSSKPFSQNLEVKLTCFPEGKWYIELNDQSTWELKPHREKPKQSWADWWNNKEPTEWQLSDEYFFDPMSWNQHAIVSVYLMSDATESGYHFVIVNEENGQKALAESIPSTDFEHSYVREVLSHEENYFSSDLGFDPAHKVLVFEDGTTWKVEPIGIVISRKNQGDRFKIVVERPAVFSSSSECNWDPEDMILIDRSLSFHQMGVEDHEMEKDSFLVINLTKSKWTIAHQSNSASEEAACEDEEGQIEPITIDIETCSDAILLHDPSDDSRDIDQN